MKVRELMSTPVVTVTPGESVAAVARLMVEEHFSGLPIVSDGGKLMGIVTEEDVVGKHANVHAPRYFGFLGDALSFRSHETDEEMRRVLAVTASDLMSDHVVFIGPDHDVDEAATLMVEKHVNPLPVVDNGLVVGIISHADILRLVLSEEDDGEAGLG